MFHRQPTETGDRSLMPIETTMALSARGGAKRGHLRSRDLDRICRQALEEVVAFDRRLHRSPHREPGQEGFGKGDEPRAGAARLGNQRAGLVDRCGRVQKYRRHVSGTDLELG